MKRRTISHLRAFLAAVMLVPAMAIAQEPTTEISTDEGREVSKKSPSKFRFGLSFGLATGQNVVDKGGTYYSYGNTGTFGGRTVSTQTGYAFTVEFGVRSSRSAFGLRFTGSSQPFSSPRSGSVETQSITGSEIFYLGQSKARPFLGAALGIYSVGSSGYSFDDWDYQGFRFGFCPRAGVEVGRLFFSLDYNILGTASKHVSYVVGSASYGTTTLDYHLNYLSISIGYFFEGG